MFKNDTLTEKIIKYAYLVHSGLGPGLKERVYQKVLSLALAKEGLQFENEKIYEVIYQDQIVGKLRIDLLVEDKIIVGTKDITGKIPKLFEAQVLSYLKITKNKIGLLINFGEISCQVRRLMM